MADKTYENVMEILEDERRKELECAFYVSKLMKKTLNPFKRMKRKKYCEKFMNHSIGIETAICRIKRELES